MSDRASGGPWGKKARKCTGSQGTRHTSPENSSISSGKQDVRTRHPSCSVSVRGRRAVEPVRTASVSSNLVPSAFVRRVVQQSSVRDVVVFAEGIAYAAESPSISMTIPACQASVGTSNVGTSVGGARGIAMAHQIQANASISFSKGLEDATASVFSGRHLGAASSLATWSLARKTQPAAAAKAPSW